jgi:hypothetical protein
VSGNLGENLRGSVAASAAPYGYTISIWSSGAVAMGVLGDPAPGEVLLFLGGASAGFLALALVVFGSLTVELQTPDVKRLSLLGVTHLFSAAGAVLCVWGACELLGTPTGWPAAGFLATVVYLTISALQVTAAAPGERP